VFQPRQIIGLRNFERAERRQMRGGELAIEQFCSAPAQCRNQPRQRHL